MRVFPYIYYIKVFIQPVIADSFKYNTLNNHGVLGLINMPSARFYDESTFGITAYYGNPDQKITFTSMPYDWLEASFYTNINDKPYCNDPNRSCLLSESKRQGF